MKNAIFLHLYYRHLWQEIMERLKSIPFPFNLYINLVESHTDSIDILKDFPEAIINISPNQGMDCGGQLRTLHYWLEHGHNEELIIFLHSKGKPLTETPAKTKETDELRNLLWSIVTPEKYPLVEQAFLDEKVGMVGEKSWHRYPPLDHGSPIPECEYYCNLLKLNNYETNNFGFCAGTMFFVRSKIFKQVFSSVDILKIVEELPISSNGGNIHALERIFGYIVLSEQFKIAGVSITPTLKG